MNLRNHRTSRKREGGVTWRFRKNVSASAGSPGSEECTVSRLNCVPLPSRSGRIPRATRNMVGRRDALRKRQTTSASPDRALKDGGVK
jgi:hypothetical protein